MLFQTASGIIPGLPTGDSFALSDEDSIRREMTEAGFRNVAVHRIAQELKAAVIRPVLERDGADQRRRSSSSSTASAPERWQTLGPKIRERVGATLGDGPLTIGRGAFVGVGTA